MRDQIVIKEEKSRNKIITAILVIILSIGCIFCGIGFLTQLDRIEELYNPLGVYDDDPNAPAHDSSSFDSFINLAEPAPVLYIPDEPAKEEYFDINFSGEVPDIYNAKPGQSYAVDVSVTNENISTDAAYIKIDLTLPTINGDNLLFQYHAVNDWDITYTPQADSMLVTAIYEKPVQIGERVTLFDSVTVNKSLSTENMKALKNHAQVTGNGFNIKFDAIGKSATGFDSYKAAFQA